MWQVRFRDHQGDEQSFVFDFHHQARDKARQLMQPGCRVRVTRAKTDILILDPVSQQLVAVNSSMSLTDALKWASRWAKTNRSAGCVLWPSGSRLPEGWSIVSIDD